LDATGERRDSSSVRGWEIGFVSQFLLRAIEGLVGVDIRGSFAMLNRQPLVAFLSVSDPARAKAFYQDTPESRISTRSPVICKAGLPK
jgi:hypothetical protein